MTAILASASPALGDEAKPPPGTIEACLHCHGKHDVTRKDASSRKASVYVDQNGLARSEHRGMVCLDCHSKAFNEDPHPADAKRASCTDCHSANERDKDALDAVHFADVVNGFEKSVHATKVQKFRCIHCHDAHTFQLETTRDRIMQHNRVCLRCHASEEQFQKLVGKPTRNLDRAHAWLPNRDLHWEHVRCLDCHTGYDAPVGSHLILPKEHAVRKCVACHSETPTQLLRLYSRMRKKELRENGFLNATIMNESYVIGATRNGMLDAVALLTMGGAAGGIAAHGVLRLAIGAIRRRRRPATKESAS